MVHHNVLSGDTESQWHQSFQIPLHFSRQAEEAIASRLLTRSVHTEIIQSISSLMMVHTTTPELVQYNTVCQKPVEQYPNLKDIIGLSGYVSYA